MACNCNGGPYCCRNNQYLNLDNGLFKHSYRGENHYNDYKDGNGELRCRCGRKIETEKSEGEEDGTSNRS